MTTIEDMSVEDKEIKDDVNLGKDTITLTLDFEDFKSVFLEEIGTLPIPDDNAKLLFEDLQNRAREKEEKKLKSVNGWQKILLIL